MNKKQLLEAIEAYPDDTPIFVATGSAKNDNLYVTSIKYPHAAAAWSIAEVSDAIILEL